MKRNTEVVVGATILLGIALIVFGTIFLQGRRLGREDIERQAYFTSVGQLLDGSTVKLRGVPIGRVESIELVGAGVVVTFSTRADAQMPEDPAVILSPESMFGDWQAEVVPRAEYPTYRFEESPDPAILPGYALPDMSRLTAAADQIAGNLNTISERVEMALTENAAEDIRNMIGNLQLLSSQLNRIVEQQESALGDVAANLRTTSVAANDVAETLRRTLVEVEGAVGGGRLNSIVSNVERTTARTDTLTVALASAARDLQLASRSADSAFHAVSAIAARVERGEGSLGLLVQDTALYVRLAESTLQLQALLRDMRENPRKYINLTIF